MGRPPRPASAGLLGLAELLAVLRPARAAGRRLVFTNGCFDLLHVGHLRLLETAAGLGELLVVGLNDDAGVRRLKGPGRPVLPFAERARLLAALEPVDWVVGFDAPTPLELIERLEPDVLVKGADWPLDGIVGRPQVEARGGRVVTLPLVPARSTSGLIARIRQGRPPRSPRRATRPREHGPHVRR